jgi:hypothetical protein
VTLRALPDRVEVGRRAMQVEPAAAVPDRRIHATTFLPLSAAMSLSEKPISPSTASVLSELARTARAGIAKICNAAKSRKARFHGHVPAGYHTRDAPRLVDE